MSRIRFWQILLGHDAGCTIPELPPADIVRDIGGLLYYRLDGLGRPAGCDGVHMCTAYRITAASNLLILHELKAVLRVLGDLQERVLMLPGASLLRLYPDIGCRSMDDVDLLAAPGAWDTVRAALRKAGLRSPHRYPGTLTGTNLTVDLHQDVLNSGRVPLRRLGGNMAPPTVWDARRTTTLDGFPITVAGREDEIVYTAAHAVRHGFSRPTWLVDLALLLQQQSDEEALWERARRHGLARPLIQSLYLLHREACWPLPRYAATQLRAQSPRGVERLILQHAGLVGCGGGWGDVLWSCNIKRRWDRLRFLGATAFPRPAVLLQVFPFVPRSLVPVAYFLRVLQLLLKLGRLTVRLLRRGFG